MEQKTSHSICHEKFKRTHYFFDAMHLHATMLHKSIIFATSLHLKKMNSIQILRQNKLKCTDCRAGILDVLMKSEVALSENDIKLALHDQFDRTTFYRSFKTLLEHELLHKVRVDSESKYMVSTPDETLPLNHYHFYCVKCGKVFCINDAIKNPLSLPEGFKAHFTELIVKGNCAACL